MIRRALRVSSAARPSSWLCVASGLALSFVFIWMCPALWRGLETFLPWWLAQALPPVLYGLLTRVSARRAPWPRLLGATALLWAAHLVAGALIGAAMPSAADAAGTARLFVPVFPQLLWVPLLLIPLHDVIADDRRRAGGMNRARTRVPNSPATTPSVSGAATPVSPAVGTPPPGERVTTPSGELRGETSARPPHEATASRMTAKPGPRATSMTTVSEAPTARPVLDEMLARDTSGDVVRITFARVADQLPSAGFNVSLDRVADGLREPGHLLIPTRLALAQLAEGIVRAGWETVADQFPRHLVTLDDAEIAKRLRDGQLVLPLDELVPQLPPELFRSARPLVDLQGIEEFPEPFKPAGREPAVSAPVPFVESAPPDATPAPTPAESRGALPMDVLGEPSVAPLASVGVSSSVEPVTGEWASAAGPVDAPARAVSGSGALTSAGADSAGETMREPEPLASVAEAAPEDDRAIAAEICSLLSSAGPLNSTVDAEDSVTVLCISAPGFSTGTTVATARLMLPIMSDGCAPWPIGQLTIRGTGEALVLTPMPPAESRERVLMVVVPAGGSLALLETLCRRAAAAHGNHARPSSRSRGGNSGLLELEPSARMRQIAESFDAADSMTTMAFRDAETVLALFLPTDWDAHAVAGVASDLARAMRKGATCAGPWQTADAVGGEHRLMLRLPDLASGCADVVTVVGGRIDRRGLAYRQLESAARALRAG